LSVTVFSSLSGHPRVTGLVPHTEPAVNEPLSQKSTPGHGGGKSDDGSRGIAPRYESSPATVAGGLGACATWS